MYCNVLILVNFYPQLINIKFMFFVKINTRVFVLLCKTYNETLQQVFAYVLVSHKGPF